MPLYLSVQEQNISNILRNILFDVVEDRDPDYFGEEKRFLGLYTLRRSFYDLVDPSWPFLLSNVSLTGTNFLDTNAVDDAVDFLETKCLPRPEGYSYENYLNTIDNLFNSIRDINGTYNINRNKIIAFVQIILYNNDYMRKLNIGSLVNSNGFTLPENYERYNSSPQNIVAENPINPISYSHVGWSDGSSTQTNRETRENLVEAARRSRVDRDINNEINNLNFDVPPLLRPSSHSSDDQAHNLTVKYNGCYLFIKDKVGTAYRFVLNAEKHVYISYIMADKELTEIYSPDKHKFFMPDLGWAEDGPYCMYFELKPGSYLRGLSVHNTSIKAYINKFKYTQNRDWRMSDTMAKALVSRSFISISDGIKNKLPNIIITPELMLFLAKHNTHEKYLLMLGDICIGEHLKMEPAIRLYKPFKPQQSFIEGILNYEIK